MTAHTGTETEREGLERLHAAVGSALGRRPHEGARTEDDKELSRLRKINERLRTQVADLRKQIDAANDRIDELLIELDVERSLPPAQQKPQQQTKPPAPNFSFGAPLPPAAM